MDLDQAAGDLEQRAGALERHLAGQLAAALARPGAAETRAALAAAAEVYREIGPQDALEKLLAVQMIAGHEAALDGFARARAAGLGAGDEAAKRSELRLAARLSALFARQAGTLRRHRTEARRARAAADKQAARKAAKAQAEAQVAAKPKGGGVIVVPSSEPPEAEAERMAEAYRARRRAEKAWREGRGPKPQAGPDPNDPYVAAAAKARAEGRGGCLIVPEKLSEEEWTRAARIYQRALLEEE